MTGVQTCALPIWLRESGRWGGEDVPDSTRYECTSTSTSCDVMNECGCDEADDEPGNDMADGGSGRARWSKARGKGGRRKAGGRAERESQRGAPFHAQGGSQPVTFTGWAGGIANSRGGAGRVTNKGVIDGQPV